MKPPKQSAPVARNVSTAKMVQRIKASGLGCTACCAACDLPPAGSGLCKLGCEKIGGCRC